MSIKPTLFLVVLGGRTSTSHIELHDVRWVVGTCIEETIPTLRQQWFGLLSGLHIDSYVAVTHVDGYSVELIADDAELAGPDQGKTGSQTDRLWFINVGGYDRASLQEQHQFGLVVAPSKQAAKARVRRRWLTRASQVHKDDLHGLECLSVVDDCCAILRADGWRVHLRADPAMPISELKPDWFGYWRIDGKVPKPRPD